jgi:hypothetical protein
MKRVASSIALAGLLIFMTAGLMGCVSGSADDSDQPWNVPPPNEGVPTLPGMNG